MGSIIDITTFNTRLGRGNWKRWRKMKLSETKGVWDVVPGI